MRSDQRLPFDKHLTRKNVLAVKILAFGASTSSKSINRQLAHHAASLVGDAEVTDFDLASLALPLFSVDQEEAHGVPQAAKDFLALIDEHDALVISLAEHNGSYAAAFKNLYDWASRERYQVWGDKKMILLATSPGEKGGANVLAAAEATFPRMGADLRGSFSLPSFDENFSAEEGVTSKEHAQSLQETMAALV